MRIFKIAVALIAVVLMYLGLEVYKESPLFVPLFVGGMLMAYFIAMSVVMSSNTTDVRRRMIRYGCMPQVVIAFILILVCAPLFAEWILEGGGYWLLHELIVIAAIWSLYQLKTNTFLHGRCICYYDWRPPIHRWAGGCEIPPLKRSAAKEGCTCGLDHYAY
jgi:hypothetical protein